MKCTKFHQTKIENFEVAHRNVQHIANKVKSEMVTPAEIEDIIALLERDRFIQSLK